MYQALYRKYRPLSFDDVVGQAHVTDTLKKQVQTDRLSHAYLFVGTRGTGKTTCARILARAVNCERPVNGNPCNECAACRGILDSSIMDVVELDAASNNGVDNVRALRDEAIFSPASVKKRVYIIDEVHMLSTAAFNALLKILEEPPEHLMFILCTTELRKVLPTIVSRCQRHSFKRLVPTDIAGRLLDVAGQEGIDLSEDAANLLARLADGGMRDGLSLLDQCSAAEHIDEDAVLQAIGLAGSRKTAELLDAVFARDSEKALRIFHELWQQGKDPAGIIDELGSLLRDILLTQVAPKSCDALSSGAWPMKTLSYFAKKRSSAELLADLNTIESTPTGGANPRRSAELCLVSLCVPECGEDLTALRARVSRLERSLSDGSAVVIREATPAAPKAEAAAKPASQPAVPAPAKPAEPEPLPEDEEEYVYDDSDAPPEEPFAPAVPVPAPAPTPTASAPADIPSGGFWTALLPRLKDKLEVYMYSMIESATQASGVLTGDELTIHVTNPFTLGMLSEIDIKSKIQQEAGALHGKPVTVNITDSPAPTRQPDAGKIAQLNKFSNFKME